MDRKLSMRKVHGRSEAYGVNDAGTSSKRREDTGCHFRAVAPVMFEGDFNGWVRQSGMLAS